MNDAKLEQALSVMSGELRAKLLSDIKDPILFDRIRKCIDRETESEIFESPFETNNSILLKYDNICAPYYGGYDPPE